jgi:hypothetical protein
MRLDLIGTLKPFVDVNPGEFFLHFAGGARGLGLKIHRQAAANDALVLAFDNPPHPSIALPWIVTKDQFQNRDVMVISDTVVQPNRNLKLLQDGSPSANNIGALVFVGGVAFVRAWDTNVTTDVNLATGEAVPARAHPGSMWADQWKILFSTAVEQDPIFERVPPAKARAA